MAEASQQKILDAVRRSLASGEYSDLMITCGDNVHKVHKMIVCHRSGFFARAVKFGGKETEESIINLPEDEPAIIALLVQYLYEGDYDPKLPSSPKLLVRRTATRHPAFGMDYTYEFPHSCNKPCRRFTICPHHTCTHDCASNCGGFICNQCTLHKAEGGADEMLMHAKLYLIADKYDVDGLEELSCKKFASACATFWKSDAFPTAAHYAFSTTDDKDIELRDAVISTIAEHVELIRNPEIQAPMEEFSALSFGVLLKKADEQGWGLKK